MTKTEQYTRFVEKQELHEAIKRCATQFSSAFVSHMISSDDLLTVGIHDRHGYVNHIAQENSWPEYVRKIFLQCYYTAELKAPGSGNISVALLCNSLIGNNVSVSSSDVFRISTSDAFKAVLGFIDSSLSDMIEQSIRFIGVNGKFSIKKTESTVPTLELRSNHRFKVGLDDNFVLNSIKRDEAKILVYDGQIQDVGQVDRLFNECHEKKLTCVLIARSFSGDVISTINANQKRNTLDVIPVKVNDEITNFNIMGDIALCSETLFIHSGSGIRISNTSVSDISTVTNLTITGRTISFDRKQSAAIACEKRISKINDKIKRSMWADGMTKQDVDLIYGQRLMALSSNIAILWVNGSDEFIQYLNNTFSFAISMLAAFANTGAVSVKLHKNKEYIIPAGFVDVGASVAEKIEESILGSGGCVELQ